MEEPFNKPELSKEEIQEQLKSAHGAETVSAPELVTIEKEELEKLRAQVKDHQDKYLRLLAESENARKRLQKEKIELQAYARENIICEFLNPIDHFEKALNFREGISEEVKNWMVGFDMILTQFKDILFQNDIKPIDSLGKIFNPHFHEALEAEENDEYPINTIIKEYVRGYQMGDRMIRPSKVKVTKKKALEAVNLEETKEPLNQKEG